MIYAERDVLRSPSPILLVQATTDRSGCPGRFLVSLLMGDSIISLGDLFHIWPLSYLCCMGVQVFMWNFLGFYGCPLPLALSVGTTERTQPRLPLFNYLPLDIWTHKTSLSILFLRLSNPKSLYLYGRYSKTPSQLHGPLGSFGFYSREGKRVKNPLEFRLLWSWLFLLNYQQRNMIYLYSYIKHTH